MYKTIHITMVKYPNMTKKINTYSSKVSRLYMACYFFRMAAPEEKEVRLQVDKL